MKFKNLTLFTLGLCLVCIAARTITLIYATESSTGFFINRLSSLGIALSFLIFALVLVAFIFSFFIKETASLNFKTSKITGIISILLGISILFYSLNFNSHSAPAVWQTLLEIFSGVLSGVWFVAFGLKAFINFYIPNILAILPCVHWVFRLIVAFTKFSTAALIAEHVFTLAYLGSVMVFMLVLGKTVAGITSKNTAPAVFKASACAFMLTATSVYSRLLALLFNASEKIHSVEFFDISGIVLSLFIMLVTIDIYNKEER